MANIVVLKLIFLVNGLEVCALKQRFQRMKFVLCARENLAYNRSGRLGRAALLHEGNNCGCDQPTAKFNITTGDDASRLWNEFELSYVGSWHTLNRRHCRLSLMWKTFCEKTVCLAGCDREQKKDLADAWAIYCGDHWQKEADEFKKNLKLEHTDDFSDASQDETYSQEQIDLWMKKVTHTLPPCEVCVEPKADQESQEAGLPDACKKQNNVHTTVDKLLDSAMTEKTPDTAQLSVNETTVDSHHNGSAPSRVIVPEFCQQECSHKAQTFNQIWAAPVSTNSSAEKFYDEIGYTWVKSWHFMNRMHCHVALASLKWCQRSSCYRECQSRPWGNKSSSGKQKSECQTIWEAEYSDVIDTLGRKTLDELMARNIPSGLAQRWWGAVVRTFEACAPCADESAGQSIPQPCWHEYNIYSQVWFQSLPEKKEKDTSSHVLFSTGIVYLGICVFAIVVVIYWCARSGRNWVYNRSRVNKR